MKKNVLFILITFSCLSSFAQNMPVAPTKAAPSKGTTSVSAKKQTTKYAKSNSAITLTSDDKVALLKAQNQITDGNYRYALEILSKISSSGKSSSDYLNYSASCCEKIYAFDKAAKFYKQLFKKSNNSDVLKKIAEMEEYNENKKNVIKVDSLLKEKATAIERSVFFEEKDVSSKKLVIIGKVGEEGYLLTIYRLPSFELNTLVPIKNETEGEGIDKKYSFIGEWNIKFPEKYSACNKLAPKSVTMFGDINFYFNKLFVLIFTYTCHENPDGSFSLTKDDDGKPSGRWYIKEKNFSFN